jgi:SET domain-containing protein 6
MYSPESESMTVDQAGTGDRRRAMAVQVIEGEKAILEEAVNAVSDASLGLKKRAADTLEDEAAAIRNPGKK